MGQHVVVTGAGGFVGGYVARYLADCGMEVTAISRRVVSDVSRPGLRWRVQDLNHADALPPRFDSLIHCAAEIPARCPDPDRLYRGNFDVSRSVFDQSLQAGAASVVFLSSMSAYGSISAAVVTEDLQPGELDTYGRAKRDAESLLEACVERGLGSGLSIRLPGTVGKGSHDNFLSTAMSRVLSGQVVEARNPDALFNNVVFVGDLAAFLRDWIIAPRKGYAVTNIASSEPLAFREVFRLLFEAASKPLNVKFLEGGKAPFLISNDRAIRLGYSPATVRSSLQAFVHASLET